jgi:hypothetical protein
MNYDTLTIAAVIFALGVIFVALRDIDALKSRVDPKFQALLDYRWQPAFLMRIETFLNRDLFPQSSATVPRQPKPSATKLAPRFQLIRFRAFKMAILVLWLLTLAVWLYSNQRNTDARYVYDESRGTVFDKRTGTLYRIQDGKWIPVASPPRSE